jgi:enterochelin esterase-like enzyme
MLFSPYGVTKSKIASNKNYPTNFYIAFGTKELDFVINNSLKTLEKIFKKSKNPHEIIMYDGGHEKLKWKETFGKLMIKLSQEL